MASLGPWYCDQCGQTIDDASGRDVGSGYVLWHPRGGDENYRIVHKVRCDDDTYPSSAPLENFLGPDGLVRLTSFLSLGPIMGALGQRRTSGVEDLDGFVDFVRRVQVPGYEEARRRYDDPDVIQRFSDATETYPYLQEAIRALMTPATR